VSYQQYAPKHRAALTPVQPAGLSGPRHIGPRRHTARKAVRRTVTMGGLAMAATGVAVAAGVVNSPSGAVNLADSLTPTGPADSPAHAAHAASAASPASPARAGVDLRSREAPVSRSADRTQLTDRRETRDPSKQAALGLTSGPAVSGQESVSSLDPQSIAQALLPSYGWSSSEMSCLVPLWDGESGWRVDAENPSSGAYGIPQALPGSKMASAGADWQTNPETQIKWGLGYIQERYGSPCGAWGFKQGHGWY
jgi:hypothetical protein